MSSVIQGENEREGGFAERGGAFYIACYLSSSYVTLSGHPPSGMMWQCCYVLLLATLCLGQQQRPYTQSSSGTTGERQIKLDDIERDNLAANQKTSAPTTSQPQQPSLTQQQLAAYQQQFLLQQLQQQYFAPSPLAYGHLGGVPLMIIPSNHLGVGGAPVPIQAFFVPAADPSQYLASYTPQAYQFPSSRYQQSQTSSLSQRLPATTPDLSYNSLQAYRPQSYPSASIVYAGTPLTSSLSQPQAYQQQTAHQYNAYNTLYQQQQDKNSFAAGVKSTPAPPVKPQSSVYTQQSVSPVYSNYKNYNYNQ